MPIDSAAKRKSIAAAGWYFMPVGIAPNVSKPQGWRQDSGWSYFGINATNPAGGGTPLLALLGVG